MSGIILTSNIHRGANMYEKPEVTRYSGTELLDLMGPVEMAYCTLEAGQEDCNIIFSLPAPEGMVAEDFDGFGFILDGPNDCETVKEPCFFDNGCLFEVEDNLNSKTVVFYLNLCQTPCDVDGTFTVEAWWLEDGWNDGKVSQSCIGDVDYQLPIDP
jgi:hypothetical protein